MKIYYCSLAWKCPKNKQSAESLALIFISHYCHSVTYLSVSQYDRVFWQWHFWAQRTTSADYSLHISGRKTTKWAWCWVEQHVWNLWQTTHKHTHEKKPRGSFKVKWNERETKRVGEFGQKERREINWKGREYYGVLQEFLRRKEKKTREHRKGIVLRAVVFLSVLLFKGTWPWWLYHTLLWALRLEHNTVQCLKNWSCRDGPDRVCRQLQRGTPGEWNYQPTLVNYSWINCLCCS